MAAPVSQPCCGVLTVLTSSSYTTCRKRTPRGRVRGVHGGWSRTVTVGRPALCQGVSPVQFSPCEVPLCTTAVKWSSGKGGDCTGHSDCLNGLQTTTVPGRAGRHNGSTDGQAANGGQSRRGGFPGGKLSAGPDCRVLILEGSRRQTVSAASFILFCRKAVENPSS